MRVKNKIKNKLESNKKILIKELNWKKNNFSKRKSKSKEWNPNWKKNNTP